jgi:hypothetical protein
MKTGRITGSFEFYKRIETGWSFDPVLFLKQKNFSFGFLNKNRNMNNYVKGNILIFIQVSSAISDLTFVKFNS